MLNKLSKNVFSIMTIPIIYFIVISSDNAFTKKYQKYNYKPKEGYVSNAETAIKIAEAIWLPVYGSGIYKSKPFVATLSEDGKVWRVTGTLFKNKPDSAKGNKVVLNVGGVPYIEINKQDCQILRMYHSE